MDHRRTLTKDFNSSGRRALWWTLHDGDENLWKSVVFLLWFYLFHLSPSETIEIYEAHRSGGVSNFSIELFQTTVREQLSCFSFHLRILSLTLSTGLWPYSVNLSCPLLFLLLLLLPPLLPPLIDFFSEFSTLSLTALAYPYCGD